MRLWMWVGLGIWLLLSYFLLPAFFYLTILIIIIWLFYILYRYLERRMAPPGKRIRHGPLRGHLQQEYGTKEGTKLYKEMVFSLRKKGYR